MKYLKVASPLLILGLGILLFILAGRVIKVDKIICFSQYGPCSSVISEKLAGFEKKPLRESKAELATFLRTQVLVDGYSFQYKLPNQLIINLVEKKPKFSLKSDKNDAYALVDKTGLVIKIQNSTNLPYLLTTEQIPNVGEKATEKQIFALNIIYNMFSSYQVRGGKIQDDSLLIELPTGLSVIFPLEGDREVLLGSLNLILERLKDVYKDSKIEKGAKIRVIDLRFKNPVLR